MGLSGLAAAASAPHIPSLPSHVQLLQPQHRHHIWHHLTLLSHFKTVFSQSGSQRMLKGKAALEIEKEEEKGRERKRDKNIRQICLSIAALRYHTCMRHFYVSDGTFCLFPMALKTLNCFCFLQLRLAFFSYCYLSVMYLQETEQVMLLFCRTQH